MAFRLKTILTKNIGLVPADKAFFNNQALEAFRSPLYELRDKLKGSDINLETVDRFSDWEALDVIIYFDTPFRDINYNKAYRDLVKSFNGIKILFLFEAPVIQPKNYNFSDHRYFDYIFTWNDDLVDNKKYFKFLWPQSLWDRLKKKTPYRQKKLLTLINANRNSYQRGELYSERRKVIRFFEEAIPDQFDLYGRGWDKPAKALSLIVIWNSIRNYNPKILFNHLRLLSAPKSFKGEIVDKLTVLSQYKFAVCFENMTGIKGYITEKIWDCFKAKVVPIYLGADNISDFVPKNCFIDFRDFNNYDELLNYLQNMNAKKYNEFIKNINNFMKSTKALRWFDAYWGKDLAVKISDIISL